MTKLFLVSLAFTICSITLSAQHDKKDPLIIIDGKITNTEIEAIDPETIESINVLKDKEALVAYGVLGKNGVFQIVTKDYIKPDATIDQKPEALFLVNGKPHTSGINSIDPNTIESVNVLKDQAATDVYGVAGENGVILVTTTNTTKLKK
ncbi:MAG: TonB-dependent receptor plug domain-containing protein [Bacteroidota bacterium]